MKPLFWILALGILVYSIQYSLFKENGEPRHIPTLQQILR